MSGRWHRVAIGCKGAVCTGAALLSVLSVLSVKASAQTAEDYLQHRWYRVEVVLFEQIDENDTGAATPQAIEAMRYPRLPIPLAERTPPADSSRPFGASYAADAKAPLVISNLAPPIWHAGECAAESWQPTDAAQHDPCLPQREVDLEAFFSDDPHAVWAYERQPDQEALVEPVHDPRRLTLEALDVAFDDYERQLMETSYVWHRRTPALAPALDRLRRGRAVIAAGSWHQALPPRDAPQPLVVQVGTPDAKRQFPLEGWISVTAGRYVHLRAHLLYRLADGDTAIFHESRRMRSDELHYLDHPALGILALVQPVETPSELNRLIDEYRLAAGR